MSLEASLFTILSPLVSGNVYPDITPEPPVFPCIIYQQVGGKALDYADKTLPANDNARVQVLVWAKTRLEASTLIRQVRVALMASTLNVRTVAAAISQYHEYLALYGARQDFDIDYPP
ncbi:MAG TPA: DUF3168 domain-containing protein [Rhodanobacteraceae bacterium]|nr:DUF3168 domain-containing protein [Rhodanobacteraceae bacterium]